MPSRLHLRRRRWTCAPLVAATSAGLLACMIATAPASARGAGSLADRLAPLHLRGVQARRAERLRPTARTRRARRRARQRHGHGRRGAAHAARTKGAHHGHPLLVLLDLRHLAHRGAIPRHELRYDRHIYLQALHTLRHLQGTRHSELASVINNVRGMAADKELIPTRLPALFATVRRNREWWAAKPLLSYGQRVSFPGSRLVWEYYPGEGIELQWLATFGEANGYYLSGDQPEALRQVLEEAEELAVSRAGGLAWEYLFHFDGGSPPWTSGLAQGTAIQAFSRASSSLSEPEFAQVASRALGLFETPPPEGVRIQTSAGAHYLEYSFAPQERILNGFIQAVTGLYDFAKLTGSQVGERLFEEGDAQARLEVPHYDTGAWSMYDQHSESDLGYHKLLTEFLHNLCERTRNGPPIAPAVAPEGQVEGTPMPAEGQAGGASAAAGGQAPTASATAGGASSGEGEGESESSEGSEGPEGPEGAAIPGDEIYCATAERFESDLHTPPAIKLLSNRLRPGARAGVRFSLSKISTISLTVRKKQKVIWTNKATVESGKPRLLWVTPRHRGVYHVSATATDLAGNSSSVSGTVRLAPHRRPGHGTHAHGTHAHGAKAKRRHRGGARHGHGGARGRG